MQLSTAVPCDRRAVGPLMDAFIAHAKCPAAFVAGFTCPALSGDEGFFRLGDLRLFGQTARGLAQPHCGESLNRVDEMVSFNENQVILPFDYSRVIQNLRLERYVSVVNSDKAYVSDHESIVRKVYYALRPLFPVAFRRILQRAALRGWAQIPFPAWPVDTTIEDLVKQVWSLVLCNSGCKEVPFIWYWPKGYQACAIMTHDVETAAGQSFCPRMLELEQEFGIKSSFELVPEVRYQISGRVVEAIRAAGSEVCIHGLCHDGRLFSSETEFRRRARLINEYARRYGATGFRSPVMYRNPAWYDAYEFSYDMSSPNVGHLDPQRGGCCTVFPFFIGRVLELPLTTVQDYPLYHILRSDPLAMWNRQLETISSRHGLASFIIHPDYNMGARQQQLYRSLLRLLRQYGETHKAWLALPCEVDQWWRQRDRMTLREAGGRWVVEGEGAERAAVAFARVVNGVVYYGEQKNDSYALN